MPLALHQPFTYGDYLRFPQEERWELIDGHLYAMSPAPSPRHQEIVGELFRQIANHLQETSDCRIYSAPFDVRLADAAEKDEEVTTVVQPDIAVICDRAKLDERGCYGAPDLVMEVLSPATAAKDQTVKLSLYQRTGVREFWVVHPTDETVMVRLLDESGRYGVPRIHTAEDKPGVAILPGLSVDLERVFAERE